MVLYYAIGGGLGHLVRARAVLHTLGLTDRAVLVTASAFADDARVVGPLPVLRVPAELDRDRPRLRRWVADLLTAERPERLIVDAFPAGVMGELCDLAWDGPVDHVARLLRWPRYAKRLDAALPRIDTVHAVEDLHADHESALRAAARRCTPLVLIDPPAPPAQHDLAGATLVVHSGPEDEVAELVSLARRVGGGGEGGGRDRIVVASPGPVADGLHHLDVHPAAPVFATAGTIVTAAGFNAIRHGAAYRDRHVFVPFRRPLDDQPARARAARLGVMAVRV